MHKRQSVFLQSCSKKPSARTETLLADSKKRLAFSEVQDAEMKQYYASQQHKEDTKHYRKEWEEAYAESLFHEPSNEEEDDEGDEEGN